MHRHRSQPVHYLGLLACALTLFLALTLLRPESAISSVQQSPTAEMRRSLRAPRADIVADFLRGSRGLPADASAALTQQAVSDWYGQFQKENDLGPEPQAFARLLAREQALLHGDLAAAEANLPASPRHILAAVAEFAGTDTVVRLFPDPVSGQCVETAATFGPLALGQDPPPGPRDNFTFFKPNISVADYESAIFGVGEDATGYGSVRPDLGGINLSGLTLNNYLLELSGGTYSVSGSVLADTLQLPHSHEYYGHARYVPAGSGCTVVASADAHFAQLIQDAAAAVQANFVAGGDLARYDADGDHIVDLFFLIHAGYGWQDGGDPDRLSAASSSFSASGLALPQIAGQDTPAHASDDLFIDAFTLFPEQLDLGAISEEFLHSLGLPDLYALDGDSSNGYWGALSAGVWGGPLGGARPLGTNLWQDWLLGWRDPLVLDYDDPALEVVLGRARSAPANTADGLIIRLPPQRFAVENRAGEGNGWWSGAEDGLDHSVWRSFDLSGAGEAITFAFDAVWDIENNRDYGYVELSGDGGIIWQTLPDRDGLLTKENPNGQNRGWGLTGSGEARLRFDLSAYRGNSVALRLHYLTNSSGINPGWWVDNLSLDDENGMIYSNELEFDVSDWTNTGWELTPFVDLSEQYYLAEWRDDNGFDRSLNDPYQLTYLNQSTRESKVSRLPAATPGLIVSYRNLREPFDYTLGDSLGAAPSYGPKYGLLVVEAHTEQLRFDTTSPNYQDGWVGAPISGRVAPGDAPFSLTPTREWSARLGFDWDTFKWVEAPIETKTWPSRPPVPAFHDSLSHWPGFFYPGSGSLIYLRDWDAGVVLPAAADYSAPVTRPDGEPYPDLYGLEIAPGRTLGAGNPGDVQAQYGLHIEVLSQSDEQALVRVWNALYELQATVTAAPAQAKTNEQVHLEFATQNVGSAGQFFAFAPLPAGTAYVPGSVSGDFFPVGYDAQQITDILAAGNFQAQTLAPADVSGFAYLGDMATGGAMAGGFSVLVEPEPGQAQINASLFFYRADGTPFREYTTAISLINTPPILTLDGDPVLGEGDPFAGSGSVTDPDPDAWSLTVDYGDGAGAQPLSLNPDHTFDLAHVYANNGDYILTVTVSDGKNESSATLPVSVSNLAPVVALGGDMTLREGDTLSVAGSFSDPGADDWTAVVDYGDNSGPQPFSLNPDQIFALSHRYGDDGIYTVTVFIHDGADTGAASFTVTVENIAPTLNLSLENSELTAPEPLVVHGSFSDPGDDDYAVIAEFDDGSPPLTIDPAPDKTFSFEHVFLAAGVRTVSVSVSDDDGGEDSGLVEVSVFVVSDLLLLADTWVASGAPAQNYNDEAVLVARNTGVDNALFMFDYAEIPAEALIVSADFALFLTLESGAWGKQIAVFNTDPFDPATVTFESAPLIYNPGQWQPVPRDLGRVEFDVREQVAVWFSNDAPDGRGDLALAMSGPNGRIAMNSLEASPATLRVKYLPQ